MVEKLVLENQALIMSSLASIIEETSFKFNYVRQIREQCDKTHKYLKMEQYCE
jgi:hypothetical protein